jgi:hypothetical protein
MDRPYTQHERTQLVHAWLDITVEQFDTKLKEMSAEDVAQVNEAVNEYAGQYISNLNSGDSQLVVQALASMSDQTLHEAVKLFGTDPLA